MSEKQVRRAPWLIRTYAGFGDAAQSNERFRANLARGQEGLSVAFDLPTQNGYDADDPLAAGEVGGTGVSLCHIGDMRQLFEGIDLGRINTSMTINATAPWLFALYVARADELGVPREALRGTTQNDILKEFVGRGTYIFGPEPSLRLQTDLITFATQNVPKWNPMNACGYHYMESGATPAQEVAFAIANALMNLDRIRPKLSDSAFEAVVKRLSFFINSGIELVPEIAKVRSYAKLWPAIVEERYGISGVRWRAGCQVRSLTLTEQQPEVNIIRIAYEALPVVLSADARVRALQLPGFREAISLPDQGEQTLALRTQQVLAYETGIGKYGDIFEGSVIIEAETDKTMAQAREIIDELLEAGFEHSITLLSRRLTVGLVEQQAALKTGERVVVGVNAFLDPVDIAKAPKLSDDSAQRAASAERQIAALSEWRASRDKQAWASARAELLAAARGTDNILDASIAFAKAGGTTGEWTAVMTEAFGGRYQAPLGTDVQVHSYVEVPKAGRPIRFYLAKSGLDGHINAVKLLAWAGREAGMEVVYSGLQQPPAAIASAAVQEDADVIGVSILSGAHLHVARELLRELKERGAGDIPVVMGGIIPDEDAKALKEMGVAAVFTPKDNDVAAILQTVINLSL